MKKLILLMLLFNLLACFSQQWYAMGRHGNCYDLTEFSTTDPLISGSKTPSDIESKLKKAGIKYTLTKHPKNRRGRIEGVRVFDFISFIC